MSNKFFGWQNPDVEAISKEYRGIESLHDLYDALKLLWSKKTCAPRMSEKWSEENPSIGQCSITSFLVQDIFGGKVYGIPRKDGNFHCYNLINDCIYDLTSEQFTEETISYDNGIEQFRKNHFEKAEKNQRYEFLKSELKKLCDRALFTKGKMRRKDREIKDFDTILSMIDSCHIVRIGIFDKDEADFPYIVPLNFGWELVGGKICLYVHGARAGRKWELLKNTNFCSVQMECDDGLELIPSVCDITERYRCVMGKARITLLEGDELVRAMEICVNRYEKCRGFDWNRAPLAYVAVWKLELTSISAKWNKIKGNAD